MRDRITTWPQLTSFEFCSDTFPLYNGPLCSDTGSLQATISTSKFQTHFLGECCLFSTNPGMRVGTLLSSWKNPESEQAHKHRAGGKEAGRGTLVMQTAAQHAGSSQGHQSSEKKYCSPMKIVHFSIFYIVTFKPTIYIFRA